MAHAFDTGLASPQRTLIQNGVVTLLAGLKRPTGYLKTVAPWAGVIRSWVDEVGIHELYEAISGAWPAILVAVGDSVDSPAGAGGFHFKAEIELLLYHASNNARDITRGRQLLDVAGAAATTKDPGLHVMLAHAKELVVGQRCGLAPTSHPSIKQARPDREEELITRPDVTIWLQTFKVTTTLSINEHRNVTQILESIRVRTTTEDGEPTLPDPAESPTTIDTYRDDLPTP